MPSNEARGYLVGAIAVSCVIVLLLSTSRHASIVLFSMPPPVVEAPFFGHARSPAHGHGSSGSAEFDRRIDSGAITGNGHQLRSVYPPFKHSVVTDSARPEGEPDGWEWKPYGHYPQPHVLEGPPMFPRVRQVRANRFGLPCTSDCDVHEASSLQKANNWVTEAAVTHMHRVKAAELEEQRAKAWAASIRKQLDSMSGVEGPVNGRCLPTEQCENCADMKDEAACTAKLGAWVPNVDSSMKGIRKESQGYTDNLRSDLDDLLNVMHNDGA